MKIETKIISKLLITRAHTLTPTLMFLCSFFSLTPIHFEKEKNILILFLALKSLRKSSSLCVELCRLPSPSPPFAKRAGVGVKPFNKIEDEMISGHTVSRLDFFVCFVILIPFQYKQQQQQEKKKRRNNMLGEETYHRIVILCSIGQM